MLKSGILLLLSFSIISVNSQLGLQLLGNNGGRGNFRNVDKSSNSGLLGLGKNFDFLLEKYNKEKLHLIP